MSFFYKYERPDYRKCCHVKTQEWDKTCPLCGKKMSQTFLWDDF